MHSLHLSLRTCSIGFKQLDAIIIDKDSFYYPQEDVMCELSL